MLTERNSVSVFINAIELLLEEDAFATILNGDNAEDEADSDTVVAEEPEEQGGFIGPKMTREAACICSFQH